MGVILREPLGQANLAIEAEELARIIAFSIKGTARNGADMRRLIAAQTAVVAAAIAPKPTRRPAITMRGIEAGLVEQKCTGSSLRSRSKYGQSVSDRNSSGLPGWNSDSGVA